MTKPDNQQDDSKISPLQLELLEMFSSRKFAEQELVDIKKMISDYYFDKADQQVDAIFEEKGWDLDEKVKQWGQEHLRKNAKA
jgi:hypothetical protein